MFRLVGISISQFLFVIIFYRDDNICIAVFLLFIGIVWMCKFLCVPSAFPYIVFFSEKINAIVMRIRIFRCKFAVEN